MHGWLKCSWCLLRRTRASLAMSVGRRYSNYYEQLEDNVKKRYNDKLDTIGLEVDDPYTFSSGHTDGVPKIEYPDIYNFLINTPSPYTKEEHKAYKSLDGYKYLLAGWVGDMSVHCVTVGEKMIVTASVRHSQSVSSTPLKPWVAAEKCGTIIILCSHCTCMAGPRRGMFTYCCLTFCCGSS